MTTLAAIYCRISADREGRELGVERQEEDCRALAGRLGFTVAEVYRDNDISASTRSRKIRPDYRRMLKDAHSGRLQAVLAYTSGRLTRRPRENEDLIELAESCGTTFHYVASPSFDLNTSAGRRIARILAANDAGEAEDIAERVSRQKLQAATDGVWKGGRRPFGFAADGVTVVENEAADVLRMTHALLTGTSLRSLAAELNARGVPTSTGAKWRQDTVRSLLMRPRNAGLMEHQGEVVGPASWPGIVPEDLWRAAVALLSDPARRTQYSSARKWLGTGLYLCGSCGGPVKVQSTSRARKPLRPVYTCRARKHVARTCEEVDRIVCGVVLDRLSRPDAADLLKRDARQDTTDLRARAVALRQRLDELAALYGDGAIDARQLREGSERLRSQLAAAEAEIAEASRGSVLAGVADAADVAAAWELLELDRRRAVIDALVVVTLIPSQRGRPSGWRPGQPYFDPTSVRIDWKS